MVEFTSEEHSKRVTIMKQDMSTTIRFFSILLYSLSVATMPCLGMNPHDTSLDEGTPGMLSPVPSTVYAAQKEIICVVCNSEILPDQRDGANRFACARSQELPNGHGSLTHYNCMDTLRKCPLCRADRIWLLEDHVRAAVLHTNVGELFRLQRNVLEGIQIGSFRYGMDITLLHLLAITQPTHHNQQQFSKLQLLIAEHLISFGVPLDHQDDMDNTALHLAFMHSKFSLALYFLQCGARADLFNKEDKTAPEIFYQKIDSEDPICIAITELLAN